MTAHMSRSRQRSAWDDLLLVVSSTLTNALWGTSDNLFNWDLSLQQQRHNPRLMNTTKVEAIQDFMQWHNHYRKFTPNWVARLLDFIGQFFCPLVVLNYPFPNVVQLSGVPCSQGATLLMLNHYQPIFINVTYHLLFACRMLHSLLFPTLL